MKIFLYHYRPVGTHCQIRVMFPLPRSWKRSHIFFEVIIFLFWPNGFRQSFGRYEAHVISYLVASIGLRQEELITLFRPQTRSNTTGKECYSPIRIGSNAIRLQEGGESMFVQIRVNDQKKDTFSF